MSEPSLEEIREHWDQCAGATATINDWRERADAAEAKLAECVRRVRDWVVSPATDTTVAPWTALFAILADYEPKTEEPGR